jgi:hypothetical protein
MSVRDRNGEIGVTRKEDMMLAKNTLRGRDLMTEMDLSRDEVETLLEVAFDLKRNFVMGRPTDLL